MHQSPAAKHWHDPIDKVGEGAGGHGVDDVETIDAGLVPGFEPVRDLLRRPGQEVAGRPRAREIAKRPRIVWRRIDEPLDDALHGIGFERRERRVEIDGASVEIHLGIANEQLRGYSILTKRLAWPATGYQPVAETFEEISSDGPRARRMVLRRGARQVLSYSWIERSGSLPIEWFRKAAALDRSLLVRPGHMLAIRLSTTLGSTESEVEVEAAEQRIRGVWQRLEPELDGYAVIGAMP